MSSKDSAIQANPEAACPLEILAQIVTLAVKHVDFEGQEREGVIEVNKAIAEDVKAFFELALELRFPIQRVVAASDPEFEWNDDKLMAANVSSGFNYRLIAGTDRPSLHGQGLAIDINPVNNPHVLYAPGGAVVTPPGAQRRPGKPGTFIASHPLVKLMTERGWEWGGNWTADTGRTDYHHFQKKP